MSNVIKNGKVVYVEPNIASDFTSYESDNNGAVYKSVNLEDMSIVVGLEVEIKGRTYMTSANGGQNTIELQWQSSKSGEKVSFMEGTKIPTTDGGFVRSLTTKYTDCHLFDVEDEATAEMFGIKHIDISYNNFMVPEVTIQFIDVRGVSLFAREEMRHNLTDPNGMSGLANNSIEGSFFKCFFTFPYPKFILKVKGFYGEMASYELTCSDFRAAFDSNTGNFNVTAKFVGYAFSFLSDVMVNGLVSAPYSEYVGRKYWDDNIENGRFSIVNKGGKTYPMVKLGYICSMYEEIQRRVAEKIKEDGWKRTVEKYGDSETDVKLIDEGNIEPLKAKYNELMKKLQGIADSLNSTLKVSNGEAAINPSGTYSYAFIIDSEIEELDELTQQFKDFYSQLQSKGDKGYKKLDDWLANPKYYFALEKYSDYANILDAVGRVNPSIVKEEALRNAIDEKLVTKLVSNDTITYGESWLQGINSSVYIYQDFGLKDILSEASNIEHDKESEIAKVKEKCEKKALGEAFGEVFKFEPSVENITKIIMAHVETFIYMISRCSSNIIQSGTRRSAGNLGIAYEQFPDIAQNNSMGVTEDTIVSPFPKVVKRVSEAEYQKFEDEWIGNILNQDQAEEIKLVDGLLNGIAEASNEANKGVPGFGGDNSIGEGYGIKYPLSYFDIFLKEGDKPFGDVVLTDVNNIFASLCVRAFSIMATQGVNNVEGYVYGMIDAENFLDIYEKDGNIKILGSMIKSITSDKVISFFTSDNNRLDPTKKSNPWYRYNKLISIAGEECRLFAGYIGGKHSIFPTKNWSFNQISKYAVLDNANPSNGLKTLDIENYILTPQKKDTSKTTVIEAREASASYFSKAYSRLANCTYAKDNDAAPKILHTAIGGDSGFDFDYERWVIPYKDWQPFIDNSGEKKYYKDAIEYDTDGHVTSTNECALDFKNIFMDELFLKKNIVYRAADFINTVFDANGYFNNEITRHTWKDLSTITPKLVHMAKFSVLKSGAYFFTTKDKINLRPKITEFFVDYFLDWAKNTYPSIESYYALNFSGGNNIETAKYNAWLKIYSQNSNDIGEAFKMCLNREYLTKFQNVYRVIPAQSHTSVELQTKPCEVMDKIINDLMKIVTVCTTSKFNSDNQIYDGGKGASYDITIKKTELKGYFDGLIHVFQEKLKKYGDINANEPNVEINSDPEDIKVGVYNYIKMLYDKWIASNIQGEFYKMETLFDGNNPTFHFLDSAYNKIGKSMILNLSTLVDRIIQSQTQNGYTLLSMLSSVYGDNKFLFLCIQNFLDLGSSDMMEKMFRPIPYIDVKEPSNHPNFVVLMPYEPSSKLDIEGADYPDDGFYLNDENTWPEMIKSKSDDGYPIPAFGVCYGQQYQNYFKDVQVDMVSPMTTEQSIKAKFMIAGAYGGNNDNGSKVASLGQDLYTIYSNNSYTCTVTMMGCAWVQPMMYFVLQNVPMFRGSYMIVKVNHQIYPGSMITTFKGVRMANTATRTVTNMMYGNTVDSIGYGNMYGVGRSTTEASYADIANDCSYAYYDPLFDIIDISSDADAKAYCYATFMALTTPENAGGPGLTPAQAKGICANIYAESTFNPYVSTMDCNESKTSHGVGGGLCGFYYNGMAVDLFKYVYGDVNGMKRLNELNAKAEPIWQQYQKHMIINGLKFSVSFEEQVRYLCNIVSKYPFNAIKNKETEASAAWWWMERYESPEKKYMVNRWTEPAKSWIESAIESKQKVSSSVNNAQDKGKTITDIANGIQKSLQMSLNATQRYGNTTVTMENKGGDFYEYKANDDNATNALFDCLLSSYGQWFDKIMWCVSTKDSRSNAIGARIHIVRSASAQHDITVRGKDSNGEKTLIMHNTYELNESLRMILIKYFKSKNISQPGVAKSIFKTFIRMNDDTTREVFEFAEVKSVRSCNSVMGGTSGGYNYIQTNVRLSEYFPNGVHSEQEAEQEMETFTLATGQTITLHKKVKNNVIAAFEEIKNKTNYNVVAVNGFSWRAVKNGSGSTKLSNHSYGLAIDINPGSAGNPFFDTHNLPLDGSGITKKVAPWNWGYKMNKGKAIASYTKEYDPNKCIWYFMHPVVQIMAKYGFGWGGRYGDTMHFSIFNGS